MIGVGTDFGAKQFEESGYWKGDFFVTKEYEMHKLIGTKHVFGGGLGTLFNAKKFLNENKKLKEQLGEEYEKVKGNFRGTDPYLSATFVIGPGETLVYSHFQQVPGDHPTNEEVLAACKTSVKDIPESN